MGVTIDFSGCNSQPYPTSMRAEEMQNGAKVTRGLQVGPNNQVRRYIDKLQMYPEKVILQQPPFSAELSQPFGKNW